MSYESVDKLQNLLAENAFSYTNDKKKASGRSENKKQKSVMLVDKSNVVRNTCTLAADEKSFVNAYLNSIENSYSVFQLFSHPFAMFECKRVGVEEGSKKGPQTIEKAKQGSYVARTVSALQRVRKADGSLAGFLQKSEKDSYGADRTRGTTIKDWLSKCAYSHKMYGAQVIALIPVATNTTHWKEFVFGEADALCFLYDTRLRFLVNGSTENKDAPMACAMIYWGENFVTFEKVFREFGAVLDMCRLKDVASKTQEQELRLFA